MLASPMGSSKQPGPCVTLNTRPAPVANIIPQAGAALVIPVSTTCRWKHRPCRCLLGAHRRHGYRICHCCGGREDRGPPAAEAQTAPRRLFGRCRRQRARRRPACRCQQHCSCEHCRQRCHECCDWCWCWRWCWENHQGCLQRRAAVVWTAAAVAPSGLLPDGQPGPRLEALATAPGLASPQQ